MKIFNFASIFLSYISLKSLRRSRNRVDKIIDDNIKMIKNTKSRASQIPLIDEEKFPMIFKKK